MCDVKKLMLVDLLNDNEWPHRNESLPDNNRGKTHIRNVLTYLSLAQQPLMSERILYAFEKKKLNLDKKPQETFPN